MPSAVCCCFLREGSHPLKKNLDVCSPWQMESVLMTPLRGSRWWFDKSPRHPLGLWCWYFAQAWDNGTVLDSSVWVKVCPGRYLWPRLLGATVVGFGFKFEVAAVGGSRECGSGWAWLGIPGRCSSSWARPAAGLHLPAEGSNRQHSSRWGQWAVPASTLWHQL